MNSTVTVRKRIGRLLNINPSENKVNSDVNNEQDQSGSNDDTKVPCESEVPIVRTSSSPDNVNDELNIGNNECRRSSRKKFIKFDVREVLSKNRKSHKIKIEARIDSNAPTVPKALQKKELNLTDKTIAQETQESIERKLFIEKLAMFRGDQTVSQEQNCKLSGIPGVKKIQLISTEEDGIEKSSNKFSLRHFRTSNKTHKVRESSKNTQNNIENQKFKDKMLDVEIIKNLSFINAEMKSGDKTILIDPSKKEESQNDEKEEFIEIVAPLKRRGRPPKYSIAIENNSKVQTDPFRKEPCSTIVRRSCSIKKTFPKKSNNLPSDLENIDAEKQKKVFFDPVQETDQIATRTKKSLASTVSEKIAENVSNEFILDISTSSDGDCSSKSKSNKIILENSRTLAAISFLSDDVSQIDEIADTDPEIFFGTIGEIDVRDQEMHLTDPTSSDSKLNENPKFINTLNSSESDASSDLSIDRKSDKSHKLRVSLKRLNMPEYLTSKNLSTSSCSGNSNDSDVMKSPNKNTCEVHNNLCDTSESRMNYKKNINNMKRIKKCVILKSKRSTRMSKRKEEEEDIKIDMNEISKNIRMNELISFPKIDSQGVQILTNSELNDEIMNQRHDTEDQNKSIEVVCQKPEQMIDFWKDISLTEKCDYDKKTLEPEWLAIQGCNTNQHNLSTNIIKDNVEACMHIKLKKENVSGVANNIEPDENKIHVESTPDLQGSLKQSENAFEHNIFKNEISDKSKSETVDCGYTSLTDIEYFNDISSSFKFAINPSNENSSEQNKEGDPKFIVAIKEESQVIQESKNTSLVTPSTQCQEISNTTRNKKKGIKKHCGRMNDILDEECCQKIVTSSDILIRNELHNENNMNSKQMDTKNTSSDNFFSPNTHDEIKLNSELLFNQSSLVKDTISNEITNSKECNDNKYNLNLLKSFSINEESIDLISKIEEVLPRKGLKSKKLSTANNKSDRLSKIIKIPLDTKKKDKNFLKDDCEQTLTFPTGSKMNNNLKFNEFLSETEFCIYNDIESNKCKSVIEPEEENENSFENKEEGLRKIEISNVYENEECKKKFFNLYSYDLKDTKERINRSVSMTAIAHSNPAPILNAKSIEIPAITNNSTTTSGNSRNTFDPLEGIEEFIQIGVDLLKSKCYKIEKNDENPVDFSHSSPKLRPNNNISLQENQESKGVNIKTPVPILTSSESASIAAMEDNANLEAANIQNSENSTCYHSSHSLEMLSCSDSFQQIEHFYETPVETPYGTPSVTPSPHSPISQMEECDQDGITVVRRSRRIKKIIKNPKTLAGRGLVDGRENYSVDEHLMDLAEVEAKNAQFLKDFENLTLIKENEYKCERVIGREARKMLCDCFLTPEEEERGDFGCGDDCLNRLLMIECGPNCNIKNRCTNKRFQLFLCAPCRVFRTEKKGFGIMASNPINPGEFIMEYVGEVIDTDEFEYRRNMYSKGKNQHYYFMALRSDALIDATMKGNISRFINHSCDPNAETQKWTVNGELRIGFFSRKTILPGEEITFDYQYQRYGRVAQRCFCEAGNCRGWIGEEPDSDGVSGEDDDDVEEDDDDDEDHYPKRNEDNEILYSKTELEDLPGKIAFRINDQKFKHDESKELKIKSVAVENYGKDKFTKLFLKDKMPKVKNIKSNNRRKVTKAQISPSKILARSLEDPDIQDEITILTRSGLRNQSDTLRLSRLMVRCKLIETRLKLLKILRKGELPCRRLFLDYHGLRLLHGWMIENSQNLEMRVSLLETLKNLPITNKTILTDTKVYQTIRNWNRENLLNVHSLSPSDESSKESYSSGYQNTSSIPKEKQDEVEELAKQLTNAWNNLPEIFRIPKKERIEQMKEHEREANRQHTAVSDDSHNLIIDSDPYQRDRFGRSHMNRFSKPNRSSGKERDARNQSNGDNWRRSVNTENNEKHLSKHERRQIFAAKVAQDEANKRSATERAEVETRCRFFGLDEKQMHPQKLPYCVNPETGQWYSFDFRPIPTPPTYAHIQVAKKTQSTDPSDYELNGAAINLPRNWRFALTDSGKIYFYHLENRIPQWEPPVYKKPLQSRAKSISDSEYGADSSASEEDDIHTLKSLDEQQLEEYIHRCAQKRNKKRTHFLQSEYLISPRREEDRLYNQIEVRRYKENKEKIRKRKEDLRRKRFEHLKNISQSLWTLGAVERRTDTSIMSEQQNQSKNANNYLNTSSSSSNVLPIQDYLLSSDEEMDYLQHRQTVPNSTSSSLLLDKIVQGGKSIDELDAITEKRVLKRTYRQSIEEEKIPKPMEMCISSSSDFEQKRRKIDRKDRREKNKTNNGKELESKYRRIKERFRCDIAGIIMQNLKPYRKETCSMGRITSNEDFNHLVKKLTHFVMIKEQKYCETVGQTLVCTESVKNKSREFIKKYMAKYGEIYVKPANDPEFKDIPIIL